jgi:hypothetical protein
MKIASRRRPAAARWAGPICSSAVTSCAACVAGAPPPANTSSRKPSRAWYAIGAVAGSEAIGP